MPVEPIESVARRTVYTRPNPVITDWLEALGMDSARFDLALPGARAVVCHILTDVPDGPTGPDGCEAPPVIYMRDAAGNAVSLTRRSDGG